MKFIGQETDPTAPAEVTSPPHVDCYVQAMQHFTNFMLPIMVFLRSVLALIWVSYGFGDTST